ncbi:glutamate--tRNA ligase [Rurimicrobium arvi]|uniref:Glutamate--tRNA ligase n=1 Tax=Rurimicrobium arvi TaxID=2049916 RepID=A0ABP8MK21_9BACT
MENRKVRVRFAPSPTGGLHLGGVRTVLYNYLFARHHGGDFVLRIEDTDQSRFVPGAEEYIMQCLDWCGLHPDESPVKPGAYGPYRQSERKALYRQYAEQLVAQGNAYYAFDTPQELEQMREKHKTEHHQAQYDSRTRGFMRNSLTLEATEVTSLLQAGTPHVIRIKMPEHESLVFTDMIRGEVHFDTSVVDDKVLLKADGMPTYHLAVVVDDYLMEITHAFRGEEWLPSAPVHLLLWQYLGWSGKMPQWAHLPLILKPDGNGKLSKRDGDRLGFPVFAMDWTDPRTQEQTVGFKERGFLPEAFVNMLAMLGWNSGMEQELFSMDELIQHFSIGRVHKGGAKFDYEKAKWFNNQYIQKTDNDVLAGLVLPFLEGKLEEADLPRIAAAMGMVKDRMHLLTEFWPQAAYLFEAPAETDIASVQAKWKPEHKVFFEAFASRIDAASEWTEESAEQLFNELVTASGLKKGEVMLPLRIMLVGGKFGPAVFAIAAFIGKEETAARIRSVISGL